MKKLAFILMVFVLCFIFLGTGFSGYSDAAKIATTADTGVISLGMRVDEDADKGNDKYKGHFTIEYGPFKFSLDNIPYFENITLKTLDPPGNVSPTIQLIIANGGSIPARIKDLDIKWDEDIGESISLKKWTINFPDGSKYSGDDLPSLKQEIGCGVIKPAEKVKLKLKFSSPHLVRECSGVISMEYLWWHYVS